MSWSRNVKLKTQTCKSYHRNEEWIQWTPKPHETTIKDAPSRLMISFERISFFRLEFLRFRRFILSSGIEASKLFEYLFIYLFHSAIRTRMFFSLKLLPSFKISSFPCTNFLATAQTNLKDFEFSKPLIDFNVDLGKLFRRCSDI